ncbi:MAG TPA: aldo/keto reductase [Candidatus Baltobacteraceae bacterium]|jgi:aryl-alcohol dehydrogenase-like predicted oxidoreductase|nr:aldo/keto reductase [Candidatus Baltobacteraceae bacterium]
MKYRTYPKTEITVSTVGFGLWTTSTGWWGSISDEDAVKLLGEAYDLGITLFDAADTYGNGRSEEQLAAAFADRRDQVVIATKFGYDFYNHADERRGQQAIPQDFSPDYVRFALEQSLRRLRTDYIDIYQIHNARLSEIENDELFALLERFQDEGKIRTYGAAFGPAIGWLVEGCRAVSDRHVKSIHMIWNILEPFPGNEMVRASYAANADTGYLIRVPHSSGMLEGKFTSETTFDRNDHRIHRPRWWLTNGLKKVEKLRFLERSNRTLGQAAIQWLLAEMRVMSVLPNIYDREQLREFAHASETPDLTQDELARIAQLAASNFGVGDEPATFKGTMRWEDVPNPSLTIAE